MRLLAAAPALLLAGLLSGCLAPANHGAQAAPAAAAAGDGALVLTDCSALQAFTHYPGHGAPGARPTDWPEAPAGRSTTEVGVRALRCQRVSLGPFERGPVRLALDWDNNAQAPAACGGEAGSTANVLATLWTDNGELAAFLRDRFAAPAFESPAEESAMDLGAGHWTRWSWGPDSGRAWLAVLTDSVGGPAHDGFRAYWPAGDAVGRIDLNWTATGSTLPRPAQGSMPPPMLAGDFTGLGDWLDGFEASGRLTLFRDAGCKEVAAS